MSSILGRDVTAIAVSGATPGGYAARSNDVSGRWWWE
jgi:hypothetical protein